MVRSANQRLLVDRFLRTRRIFELPSENAALVRGANHDYQASVMATLNIIVNDTSRVVPEGTTVESLLGILELKPRFLAVERNRQVVPRGDHPATVLADGDRLESVTLVGGG